MPPLNLIFLDFVWRLNSVSVEIRNPTGLAEAIQSINKFAPRKRRKKSKYKAVFSESDKTL